MRLTQLSTIFRLYREGQFYWWRKPEYPKKTIDMSQVTDTLYQTITISKQSIGYIITRKNNRHRGQESGMDL